MTGTDILGALSYKRGHCKTIAKVLTIEISVLVSTTSILRNKDRTSADFPRGSGIPFTEVVTTVVDTVFGTNCLPSVEERKYSALRKRRHDVNEEV